MQPQLVIAESRCNVALSLVLTGVGLIGTSGCGGPAPSHSREIQRADLEDVAEVVLRHEFGFVKGLPVYSSYCVAVQGRDPSPQFMRRFDGLGRVVRPMSECQATERGQRLDALGRPAALFQVGEVWASADDEASVRASWHPGHVGAGAAEFEFRVRRVLGQWSIADARTLAVQ
jgi:hypothetical protein